MRGTCQNHGGNTLADAMSGDSSSLPLVVLHDWLICTCRYLVALLWGSQADLKGGIGAGGSAILSKSLLTPRLLSSLFQFEKEYPGLIKSDFIESRHPSSADACRALKILACQDI